MLSNGVYFVVLDRVIRPSLHLRGTETSRDSTHYRLVSAPIYDCGERYVACIAFISSL